MKFTPVPMRRYRRPCLRQYHGASPLRSTLLEQLRNCSSNQITLKSPKLRCAIPEPSHTFPMQGSKEVVCGYNRHQGACNTSLQRPQCEFLTNKSSKESRKSKRTPLPYLHIYLIKTHLAILRGRHLAILGCISMQIIGVERETFMHAAKLQLLVVANCNLLDYIQSLHAQSSWIDAKSGIATDFDANSLVPKGKTRPVAACWILLVHAFKRKSLSVCNGIRVCSLLDAFGSCIQTKITYCM